MANNVVAKKTSIRFEQLGIDTFKSKLEALQEALRPRFPIYLIPNIQSVSINMSNAQASVVDNNGMVELHMVSADRLYALQIGNLGMDLTASKYVEFDQQKEMFLFVVNEIKNIFDIKYLAQLFIHNTNMLDVNESGIAENIKTESSFNVLENNSLDGGWSCIGAATRQDYLQENGLIGMTVHSSIAHPGQSFVPQPDWGLWQLMGAIPVIDKKCLLLNISVAHNQQERTKLSSQGLSFVPFDLSDVETKLDIIHSYLNKTYDAITKEG